MQQGSSDEEPSGKRGKKVKGGKGRKTSKKRDSGGGDEVITVNPLSEEKVEESVPSGADEDAGGLPEDQTPPRREPGPGPGPGPGPEPEPEEPEPEPEPESTPPAVSAEVPAPESESDVATREERARRERCYGDMVAKYKKMIEDAKDQEVLVDSVMTIEKRLSCLPGALFYAIPLIRPLCPSFPLV